MGAWTGLRVVLHSNHGFGSVSDGSHRSIVEIEMADGDLLWRQRLGIQGETVVLTCDFNLASGAAGVVEPAMAVSELERAATEGETENLMSQADAEKRQIRLFEKSRGKGNAMPYS